MAVIFNLRKFDVDSGFLEHGFDPLQGCAKAAG